MEKALTEFSPEKDPNYLEHVGAARLALALIAVAADDLQAAEREFATLLLINPDFTLPAGDHPPKVRYVFKQAQDAAASKRKKAERPPVPPKDAVAPVNPPKPPEIRTEPPKDPVKEPVAKTAKPAAPWRYTLSGELRAVGLFGGDTEAVYTGPGAALGFSLQPTRWLLLSVAFAYAHHAVSHDRPDLQAFSLVAGGAWPLSLGPLQLRLGGAIGTLAMGTQDRYDHWGFLAQADVVLAWPRRGPVAVTLGLHPSLLATGGGSSFFLPVGLAVEARWPTP
jgi:hypothetical protein